MISRKITPKLQEVATYFPVVAILGPRQSGKTTLAKTTFNKHQYVSLEDLDVREFALKDPRSFLERYRNPYGIILDEIQHVPTILSYIQTSVDVERIPGYFILTGSQNFLINEAVSQTLAGRIAILTLLPLSLSELETAQVLPDTIENTIFKGSYPPVYAYDIPVPIWYAGYLLTYIERDVRQIKNITNLSTFKLFMQLCAGRIGQLLNLNSLANDCGISSNTAQSWLSILEASYIIFLLYPHYKNFSRRLVKSPKLYFFDTGLACTLLAIESADQVYSHYLRGGLVECLVLAEMYKAYYNAARTPRLYFWRDNHGHEVDCIIEEANQLIPVEIKSGKTISSDYFDTLDYWNELTGSRPDKGFVIYAGSENQQRTRGNIMSWRSVGTLITDT